MQKFKKYDLVRITKDLGPCMRHFTSDCDAVVLGSYADQFGGSMAKSYTLHLKGRGETSWYEEHQLTLIKHNQKDLLDQWVEKRDKEIEIKSDLDWIFKHGNEVLKTPHDASITALAACFGLTNLWGSHGEGYV